MQIAIAAKPPISDKAANLQKAQAEWTSFLVGLKEAGYAAFARSMNKQKFGSKKHFVGVVTTLPGTSFKFYFSVSLDTGGKPTCEAVVVDDNYSSESIINVNGGSDPGFNGTRTAQAFGKQMDRLSGRWEGMKTDATMLSKLVKSIR